MNADLEGSNIRTLTIYNIEKDVIDGFRSFARDKGISRLSEALKLLIKIADMNESLKYVYQQLDNLEQKYEVLLEKIENKPEPVKEAKVKTFGGEL